MTLLEGVTTSHPVKPETDATSTNVMNNRVDDVHLNDWRDLSRTRVRWLRRHRRRRRCRCRRRHRRRRRRHCHHPNPGEYVS